MQTVSFCKLGFCPHVLIRHPAPARTDWQGAVEVQERLPEELP